MDLDILAMPVPKGARIQEECPKCGGLAWKKLYFNNNKWQQVRLQCLRTGCKHKFQCFSFRKSHLGGYKKAKAMKPEQYVGLVKVCSSCGCSNAKFYGVNNKDVQQARYKCLNSECKKLFTPFSKPRANVKRSKTTDLQAVNGNKFLDTSIMNNNLQYPNSTSKDSSVTHAVEPTMLVPSAQYAFQKNNMEEEERARLTPLVDPHHEYSMQQDDPMNIWPTPAPCNTQSEDQGATTFMPPTPTNELQEVCNSEGHVPTVAAPNLTPTTLQEEQNIVSDAPATVLSTILHEGQQPEWAIPADTEYWNDMINTDLTSPSNALDTLSLEEEFDAVSYMLTLLNG